ncbi:MAG: hypothetical protein Q9201_004884 [Fulgogasparrea decipioides]
MQFILFLGWWLIAAVSASPITLDVLSSAQVNVSLADPLLPWGPADFEVRTVPGRGTFDRKACYALAVKMVADIGVDGFDAPLPRREISFPSPNDPQLVATVIPEEGGQGVRAIARKYVLWTVARAMNQMVLDGLFVNCLYSMYYRNQRLGALLLSGKPPVDQIGTDDSDRSLALHFSQAANSTQDSNAQGSVYEYDFSTDQQMTIEDVVMGTVGAIVHAAEHNQINVGVFVGGFPRYRAFHYWFNEGSSRGQLEYFTHAMCIRAMQAAAEMAMMINNFHAVNVKVNDRSKQIAHGGYYERPPVRSPNASNL